MAHTSSGRPIDFVTTRLDLITGDAVGVFEAGPDREWRIEVTLAPSDRGRVVSRMCIEPGAGLRPGGLTTRALRDVPLDLLQKITRQQAAAMTEATVEGSSFISASPALKRQLRKDAAAFRRVPRPGPAGRRDRDYAAIAALYVEALPSGKANRTVGRQLNLSETTVRNIVREARRRGLLTETDRGKAGGELTERARQLLEETEGD